MNIPSKKLVNDLEIPRIALGLWLNKNKQECKASIKSALEVGYRHFDTAQVYANEQYVGEALNESGIPRKELFVTTKIWNENLSRDDLLPSLDASLVKLQMDYVDLLLIHFPVAEKRGLAWYEMEEAYRIGKAKAIGVSNYTVAHLKELLSTCEVRPAVNQVELHVYLQQPDLVAFCEEQGIILEAYSPLAHGYGIDNPVLQEVADKHGKTTAQVMLRWCIEQGFVILPKSTNPERIKQNADIFDFKLDNSDLEKLKGLDKNYRTCWDPNKVPGRGYLLGVIIRERLRKFKKWLI